MEDPNVTTPSTVLEVTPAEVNEVEEILEAVDGEEATDELTEEELEELSVGGKQYRLPKEIAAMVVKAENADAVVTRKTQSLAEERKAVQAEREQFHREAETNNALINEVGQIRTIEARLAQFQNVNWQQWYDANPTEAGKAQAEYTQLRDFHGNLAGNIEARKAELAASTESRRATSMSHATEVLSKPMPELGWDGKFDDAKRKDMRDFLLKNNVKESVIASIDNPEIILLTHLAMLGAKSFQQQKAAATPPKIVAEPVPTVVTGKSRASVDPDKMSQAQFNKWRASSAKKVS